MFDVKEISDRLSELFGALPGYSAPTIRKSDVSLIENEAIATVFKNSLKSYHSNVKRTEVDPHSFLYLDSALLHYWFNHYKYSIGLK